MPSSTPAAVLLRKQPVPKGQVLRTGNQIVASGFDLMNMAPVEHSHHEAGEAFVQFILRQASSMPEVPPRARYPAERTSFFVDPKINQVLKTPNVNSFDFDKDNQRNWLSGKRGAFNKQSRFEKGRSALDRHQTPDHRQSKYRWENEEGMSAGLPKGKITGAVVHKANWDIPNIPEVVKTRKIYGEENKVVKSSAKEGLELTEEEARKIRESRKFPLADDIWVPKMNVHTGEVAESFMFASKTRRKICEPPEMQNMRAADLALAGAQADWPMFARDKKKAAAAGEGDSNGDGVLDDDEKLQSKAARDALARQRREAKAARQKELREQRATVWDDEIEGRGKPNPFDAVEAGPAQLFPPRGGMATPSSPTARLVAAATLQGGFAPSSNPNLNPNLLRPTTDPNHSPTTMAMRATEGGGGGGGVTSPDATTADRAAMNTAAAAALGGSATAPMALEGGGPTNLEGFSADGPWSDGTTTTTTTTTMAQELSPPGFKGAKKPFAEAKKTVNSLLEMSSPTRTAPRPVSPWQQTGAVGKSSGSRSGSKEQPRPRPESASRAEAAAAAAAASGERRRGSRLNKQQSSGGGGGQSRRSLLRTPPSIGPASLSIGAKGKWVGSRSTPAIAFPKAIRTTFADEASNRRSRDTTHYVRYGSTAQDPRALRYMDPTERPAFSRGAPRRQRRRREGGGQGRPETAEGEEKTRGKKGAGAARGDGEAVSEADPGDPGAEMTSPVTPTPEQQTEMQTQVLRSISVGDLAAPPPRVSSAEAQVQLSRGLGFSRGLSGSSSSSTGMGMGMGMGSRSRVASRSPSKNLIVPFEGDLGTLNQITSIPRHVILSGFSAPLVDPTKAAGPVPARGEPPLKNSTLARMAAQRKREALGETGMYYLDESSEGPGVGGRGRGGGAAGFEGFGYAYGGATGTAADWFGESGGDYFLGGGGGGGGGGVIDASGKGGGTGSVGNDDASVSTCFVSLGQASIRTPPRLVVTNGSKTKKADPDADDAVTTAATAVATSEEPKPKPEPTTTTRAPESADAAPVVGGVGTSMMGSPSAMSVNLPSPLPGTPGG